MQAMMNWALAIGLAVAGSGCAMGIQSANLSKEELTAYGSHHFDEPPAKVHQAVKTALLAQSFSIAVDNPQKGVIKTGRRLIRSAARGGQHYAEAVDYSRQYVATVRAAQGGGTEVTLEPRVFAGEQDLSEQAVWVIEGELGERRLWSRLWKEIGESL